MLAIEPSTSDHKLDEDVAEKHSTTKVSFPREKTLPPLEREISMSSKPLLQQTEKELCGGSSNPLSFSAGQRETLSGPVENEENNAAPSNAFFMTEPVANNVDYVFS